jgi:hypothetical protein
MMKGRPITDEEFQRMLDVTENVVGVESTQSWRFLLNGLWWSGLRVGEAISMTWHPSDTLFLDFDTGRFPMFQISGRAEKGGTDYSQWLLNSPNSSSHSSGKKDTYFVLGGYKMVERKTINEMLNGFPLLDQELASMPTL